MNRQRGSETKDIIREMAFKMFLTKGYNSVSFEDIEERIRMSRGCIFYHYANKQMLFMDAIDYYFLKTERSCPQTELVKRQSLLEFIHCHINHIQEKINYYNQFLLSETAINFPHAYLSLLLQAGKYFPDFNRQMEDIFNQELQLWKKTLKHAQETGEIDSHLDCSNIAKQFKYLSLGMLHTHKGKEVIDISVMERQYLFLYNMIKL